MGSSNKNLSEEISELRADIIKTFQGLPLSTQFIHIVFTQNISRYRVGELYLINLP